MKKIGIGIIIGAGLLVIMAASLGNFRAIDFEYDDGSAAYYNRLDNAGGDSLWFRLSNETTKRLLYPFTEMGDISTDSLYAQKAQIDTLSADTLYAERGAIDTLEIIEIDITTVYIDSNSVIWKDYDDLSDVASYSDTVFSFHKDVVFDETIIGDYKRNLVTVNSATYSFAQTGDFILVTYTATDTCGITIPTSMNVADYFFTVKDGGMNAMTNNITVKTESDTVKIDNSTADDIISGDGYSYNYICDGDHWWRY